MCGGWGNKYLGSTFSENFKYKIQYCYLYSHATLDLQNLLILQNWNFIAFGQHLIFLSPQPLTTYSAFLWKHFYDSMYKWGDRDQNHSHRKEMQKSKMAVWGGLINSCEKKRLKGQKAFHKSLHFLTRKKLFSRSSFSQQIPLHLFSQKLVTCKTLDQLLANRNQITMMAKMHEIHLLEITTCLDI